MKFSLRFVHLGAASLFLLSISHPTAAEEATATLNATAGLSSSITLTCDTDLSFGKIMIDVDSHDGEALVTVDTAGAVNTATNDQAISSVDGGTAGECQISGSMGSDGSTVTVTTLSANNQFSPGAAEGLDAASGTNETFVLNALTDGTIDLQGGQATFNVGGTLVLPSVLTRSELGGWTTDITVTVDDEI